MDSAQYHHLIHQNLLRSYINVILFYDLNHKVKQLSSLRPACHCKARAGRSQLASGPQGLRPGGNIGILE